MDKSESKCCVCLDSKAALTQISEFNTKGDQWIAKLQNVVPEVEWSDDYNICASCTAQLDVAYDFRNLCIRLDCGRKEALIPKVEAPLVYTCYDCNAGFDDKRALVRHMQGFHAASADEPRIRHECDNCGKSYATQKVLRSHSKRCAKEAGTKRKSRSFSCEVCGSVFEFAKSVVEHCMEEHSMSRKAVKPYVCDECPMRFSSSTNLIQHKKYHKVALARFRGNLKLRSIYRKFCTPLHKGSRSHICSFCGKSYITKSDLTVHEYTHFNRRNYKCELCEKAFNTNKNLRSHNLVVHTDSSLWKFGCGVCSKRFPLKSGYEQHVRRHTGDKRFVCHVCSKPFVSRSELQKHMAYHSKVKPFNCGHCDRAYKEKRVYEVHLAKAHGIGDAKAPVRVKRFACHVCPNTFFDRQKLERHLRTHSGLKPYECRDCDKKFTDKYYLKQHCKNAHNVDVAGDVKYKTFD